jgi:short-subunit dehydrogenase
MSRPNALITGASSGIGLELARLAAADGHNVVLVARSANRLNTLAHELRGTHNIECIAFPSDLTKSNAPLQLIQALDAQGITVDVLINNAGFGDRGSVVSLGLQRQLDMVQVNTTAVTALTRLILPGMIKRKRGAILNVASTAAFQAGPNMTVYYATKAYVLHFSEGLCEELNGTGVTTTCLCPGPTVTGFAREANIENSRLFRLWPMNAKEVAQAGWTGLKNGKAIVIPGFKNRLTAFSTRLSPRSLARKIAYALQAN